MSTIERLVRCFWLLLLMNIGSNQMLKAQDTAQVVLINHNAIDVCGSSSEKEYIISIGIGEVKLSDSLFGFDFYIRYNPEKFNAISGLTINTLAQFFDNEGDVHIFRSSSDSGMIEGHYGTFTNNTAYGNMPLIAFNGRFLGQCPDTSYFRLDTIVFTSEFKKVVNASDKFVLVSAEVLDKPNRSLTASFESDSVFFNTIDSLGAVNVKIKVTNNLHLENIEFEIVLDDSENFKIEEKEIKSITTKLAIDSLVPIEKGYKIYTTILDDIDEENVFEIKLKELKRKGEIKELKITPVKVNDCACIKKLFEGKTNIKGNIPQDTTGNGIDEIENKFINGYYNEIEGKFIIKSNKTIKELFIYDVIGNLIKKISLNNIDKMAEISAEGLTEGVYIITLKTMENELNNIVMIKN